MPRIASIVLLLCFVVTGTGLAAYVHDLSHDREDAAAVAKDPAKPRPVHDENNCVIHAALRAPVLAQGWTPLLISLGLLVAFLTQLAPTLDSQHTPARIDCRGPPVLA